jgi:5-methylcytosine-specific restriction endonuclease McrA
MQSVVRPRRPQPGGSGAAPPGGMVIRFVTSSPASLSSLSAGSARPSALWSASSPWPNHPAILPPLPRLAKSALPALGSASIAGPIASPASSASAAVISRRPGAQPTQPAARPATRMAVAPAPSLPGLTMPRQSAPQAKLATKPTARHAPATPRPLADLAWPSSFDDWMIDIVRRRALRLNSGARRRGTHGAVRAVELAQILERTRDAQGRWTCALCHGPVTLNDLSFDHVMALADGGEHAAHNLVPAHRKCNEIKGSEKAQNRTQALDRWLGEWATKHNGATPRGAIRHPLTPPAVRTHDWRYT